MCENENYDVCRGEKSRDWFSNVLIGPVEHSCTVEPKWSLPTKVET